MLCAFLVAFSFAATVRVALAGHYHTYNNIPHGLVHGDDLQDGSFFARTLYYYLGTNYYCAVGDLGVGTYAGAQWVYNDTCSVWSKLQYRYSIDECAGYAISEARSNFSGASVLGNHAHYAHYSYPSSCRKYFA